MTDNKQEMREAWEYDFDEDRIMSRPSPLNLKGGNPLLRHAVREANVMRWSGLRLREKKPCAQCGATMEIPTGKRDRRFCNKTCMNAFFDKRGWPHLDQTGKPWKRRLQWLYDDPEFIMTTALRKLKEADLSPSRAARLRGKITSAMEQSIEDASDVLLGHKEWTPTQARVFGILIDKVLPDLNASHVIHEKRDRPVEEMSVADLEAMLANAEKEEEPEEDAATEEDPAEEKYRTDIQDAEFEEIPNED